jgi:glycosyltransferase involved in cell wall biosynthesis
MKVVHLLNNYKWTERSEPATDMALAEQDRGAQVLFLCGRAPRGAKYDVAYQARAKGLKDVRTFTLDKHLNVFSLVPDVMALRHVMAEFAPDVLHAHMPNGHLIAALARGCRARPALVRSVYAPDGAERRVGFACAFARSADGYTAIGEPAAGVIARRARLSADRVLVAEPAVDLARFAPGGGHAAHRAVFGLAESDFVVGLVTRIRAARRLDLVLGAVGRLAAVHPGLKLLLVGRGQEEAVREVVVEPARRLGIADRVVQAGYCRAERLVAAYRAMDALAYPMPGTDPSCRTVREAMAAALPVIASRVGVLPELVADGRTGWLVEADAAGVAAALERLMADPAARAAMSRAALETARARFSPDRLGGRVLAFHEALAARTAAGEP